MQKRKRTPDVNIIASSILDEIITISENGKNPYAVMLGRMGGAKGGKARAEKLSPERRKEIAKKAATARWSKGE